MSNNYTTFEAACDWLTRGVFLVPAQPGSKRLVAGFGPQSKRITTTDHADEWFLSRRCNLVLLTGYLVCLDFDEKDNYVNWAVNTPSWAETLTERTPGGGMHVFFMCGDLVKSCQSDVVEVKARGGCVLTAPSKVAGKQYTVTLNVPILRIGSIALLDSLPSLRRAVPVEKTDLIQTFGNDRVSVIKKYWPIVDFARTLTTLSSKDEKWYSGPCPFHGADPDKHFWVNAEKNVCGCFKCSGWSAGGLIGDVINLYAMWQGVTVKEAIKQMARRIK